MKSRFLWEDQDKWALKTSLGYTIEIVMELKKRADKPSPEFPENYKFKIMARNLENPGELVRLDNHKGKSPHYHIDSKQTYFTWISWEETKKLFYQLACKRFGYFKWN